MTHCIQLYMLHAHTCTCVYIIIYNVMYVYVQGYFELKIKAGSN